MIDLDDELAQDYLADCREHVAAIEADLLSLERGGPVIDMARFDRVYRCVHFIWGGAAFFDLLKIRELAQKMEEVLTLFCSRNEAIAPAGVRALISATDTLNELIQHPAVSNQGGIRERMETLDRLLANGQSSAGPNEGPKSDRSRGGNGSLQILLAEDDFACRLLLQTFLSRYGECHSAVNGKEAVEAFRVSMEGNQPYDLICMDIMMPEMDGREAVRRIRALEEAKGILSTAGVKIIMTTTVEDVKEVILCFRELCDAYLMKPIELTKLVEQMRSYRLIQ